ncbi:pseudaminic acid cytidylyltransferase [Phaeovibrio sulfidiphilus]|uniref:Pseudaminic acid cytidylyltransferase n=1 Tax=Phaeovibrio sulfidiphilus TaxID=1220600 RepID=A0A8J6YZF2_9PROT|nr:pseudaminic acid cytidylyltransferase [Phaeovibrio sulfidiphilus]MBE1237328.1 pseudaminic acid cytidylyltransferase [Phaeovibrio sulfidiphilus]
MSAIAIITARGGSKRIPRKNIRPFLGRPMIAWPIGAALESGVFDRVVVSTDDPDIAAVARAAGAEVPALRPSDLADDYAPAHKAARHMLELLRETDPAIRHFCHIYPTAPLLSADLLRQGMERLRGGGFRSLWAVVPVPYPVFQLMGASGSGSLYRLFPDDKAAMRSQDMPQSYVDVGQAYFFEVDHFLEHELALGEHTGLIEVPPDSAVDIDTEEDWIRAERIATRLAAEG